MAYRNGQWLKFKSPELAEQGAHVAPDGCVVGIYQQAGRDATGEAMPELVILCDKQGCNLRKLEGGQAVLVALKPEQCEDLRPVTSRDDIPPARLATMDPNWVPRA